MLIGRLLAAVLALAVVLELSLGAEAGMCQPGKASAATRPGAQAGRVSASGSGAARADRAGGGSGQKSQLVWLNDLSRSLDLARRSNKMVLVDVYTDWCGWCHKLDKDTYSHPDVIKFVNSQFVCLKLDAEDGGQGQGFAQKYRVRGYPCIMMLDASGNQRGVFYGYRAADQFPGAVQKALEKGPGQS
ncbi:MAG TPA: thioredoxin family protein [Candidatus Obscuribacterales bacterium]